MPHLHLCHEDQEKIHSVCTQGEITWANSLTMHCQRSTKQKQESNLRGYSWNKAKESWKQERKANNPEDKCHSYIQIGLTCTPQPRKEKSQILNNKETISSSAQQHSIRLETTGQSSIFNLPVHSISDTNLPQKNKTNAQHDYRHAEITLL